MAGTVRSDARGLDLTDFDSGSVHIHYDPDGNDHVHSYANVGRFHYTHRHAGGSVAHEHAGDSAVTQGRAVENDTRR